MNRNDFQTLSDVRIQEAKALLDAGFWDGAYYLAGYAVECALKAKIAGMTQPYDFPPKPRVVQDYYNHELDKLLTLANLKELRKEGPDVSKPLADNWDVVTEWSEESRYERRDEAKARALYQAIADPTEGVLSWIKARW